jgi:hypothetical protein
VNGYLPVRAVNAQGILQVVLGAAACRFAIEFPACFRMGSSFSARRVRPAAKKRLEVSPKVVCAIEFIGEILSEIPSFSHFENSLISGCAIGGMNLFSHLNAGVAEICCTSSNSSIVCGPE